MNHHLTLRDYARVLWSGRVLLVAIVAAGLLIGAVAAFTKPVTYRARAVVSLGQATTTLGTPVQTPLTNAQTAPSTLKTDEIIRAVAEKLDLKPGAVRSAVTLSAPRAIGSGTAQPTVLTIAAVTRDRTRSVAIANAYSDAVLDRVGESFQIGYKALTERRDNAAGRIERLNEEISTLRRQMLAASGAERAGLQAALYSASGQLDAARLDLQEADLAAIKAAQIEAPQRIVAAENAASSATTARRVRSILLAGIVSLLIGVIATFLWKGSPAGRARPAE